jgi:transcriptional regulator with XRE-family HTH domain
MNAEFSPQRARELRRAARLTQGQVARRIGVSVAAVCYFENGKIKPRPGVWARYDALLTELAIDVLRANDPISPLIEHIDALCADVSEGR